MSRLWKTFQPTPVEVVERPVVTEEFNQLKVGEAYRNTGKPVNDLAVVIWSWCCWFRNLISVAVTPAADQ